MLRGIPSTDFLKSYFAAAFFDQIELVCFNVVKNLANSARPGNFYAFCNHILRQAKVRAQVALREVASASRDFSNLGNST